MILWHKSQDKSAKTNTEGLKGCPLPSHAISPPNFHWNCVLVAAVDAFPALRRRHQIFDWNPNDTV